MRVGAGVAALAIVLVAGRWVVAGPTEVDVRLFQYKPGRLDVESGAEVTWTNHDDIAHTVTAGTPDGPDGRFDAPLAGQGATARIRFSRPGVYSYFCTRHPAMRGEIHVQ